MSHIPKVGHNQRQTSCLLLPCHVVHDLDDIFSPLYWPINLDVASDDLAKILGFWFQ